MAVIIKIVTLLGINKILALYVGPSGYAIIGQFQNVVQIITSMVGGFITTGVTKYIAQFKDDGARELVLLRTAGTLILSVSLIASVMIFFLSEKLSVWVFKDGQYGDVFVWLAISVTFFSFNAFLLAVLNGRKEIKLYVMSNIGGSLLSLLLVSLLSLSYGLRGALVALAIYQSFSLFVTFAFCQKAKWFSARRLIGAVDYQSLKGLSKYAAMAIVSAICIPLSHIFIRNHIGATLGTEASGYWEAMWRISSAYLMVVTMTLSVYFLPRFSELTGTSSIFNEIVKGYRLLLPATIVTGLFMYLLRDMIIKGLLSDEFLPVRELFLWQVIGDTLKIGGWLVAYIMLGKGMAKTFILTEVIFSVSFYLLVYFFVDSFGLVGTAIAHAINYAIYWAVVSGFVWRNAVRTNGWEEQGRRNA
ncbi:O-antigen translocase [Pseudomonas sp. TUM22785]|uniref:O-antigen translocase n=1 Tax=Pseudomonas sp. TUM22785 TaxID=3019098 RepID=UPI002306A0D9|nr:O-antigen translocase [Pseudomonas sp. TUM22785]WCD82148.1 O-antigen translocase [Pseudomonas sp. TUM22785]